MGNIGIGCKDRGGAHGIAQVYWRLFEKGHIATVFCNGVGRDSLIEAGVPFTECGNSPKDVLKLGLPDLWVSSMDSEGGIGFLVAQALKESDWNGKIVVVSDYPTSGGLLGNEWPHYKPDIITAGDSVSASIIRRAWPDFDPNSIIETGYPAFDRFDQVEVQAVRTRTRELLNVPAEAFFVTLLTNIDDTVFLAQKLGQAFPKSHSNLFSVRPHPAMKERAPELFDELEKVLGPWEKQYIKSDSVSTIEAICASDVIVAPCSTALAEGAMLRVPGINFYTYEVKRWYLESIHHIANRFPWAESGVVAEARVKSDVEKLLSEAKTGELKQRLLPLQEQFFPHGMRSSETVASIIEVQANLL